MPTALRNASMGTHQCRDARGGQIFTELQQRVRQAPGV